MEVFSAFLPAPRKFGTIEIESVRVHGCECAKRREFRASWYRELHFEHGDKQYGSVGAREARFPILPPACRSPRGGRDPTHRKVPRKGPRTVAKPLPIRRFLAWHPHLPE